MNRTAHNASKPGTGILAMLSACSAGQERTALRASRRLLLLVACLALTVLWLLPACASATFSRPFICQITGKAGENASASECNGPHVGNILPRGPLAKPTTLALDGSGDLWLNDVKPGLIDEFGPTGVYLAQFTGEGRWPKESLLGIAYGDSAKLLYLGQKQGTEQVWLVEPETLFFSSIGEAELGLDEVGFTAVDNSGGATNGDVYVSGTKSGGARIGRYDPTGKPAPFSASAPYIEANMLSDVSGSALIAVDGKGNLYTDSTNAGESTVRVFAPSGLLLREFTVQFGSFGIAVDPTNGDILLDAVGVHEIYEYNSDGVLLGQLNGPPAGSFSEPRGIAVDSKGRLYVSDTGHQAIDVFGPWSISASPPVVLTGEATAIAKHAGTLNGVVNPEGGELKECAFEYGETNTYGHSIPCAETPSEIGSGASPVPVHASISGLTAGAVYHFRLRATNVNGGSEGKDETLTTLSAVKLATGTATSIKPTTATLTGTVDPEGQPVSDCRFEYSGPDITQTSAPCVPTPGTGSGDVEVHADLSGLQPSGEYTFRLIATNPDGTAHSAAATFTTRPAIKLETGEATSVSSTGATLTGSVNPEGATITECRFEYGIEYAFDHTAPCSPAPGTVSEEAEVHADIAGLIPGQTYQFRLTATDSEGQTTGALTVFTTPLAPPSKTACPNTALRTGPSTNLPDCRAYELVSPPDKKGADIAGMPVRTRAASDGNAISFMSLGAFADAKGTNIATEYMAIRTATPATTGWATHAITPGNLEPTSLTEVLAFLEPRYMALSPDLNKGFFFSNTSLTSGSPDTAEVPNLYLRTDLRTPGSGSYQLLSDCPGCTGPLPQNADEANRQLPAGASTDFSHVIFESEEPLTADVAAQGCTPTFEDHCPDHLYEWANGQVSLAGMIPPTGDTRCGAPPLDACIPALNSQAGRGARTGAGVAGQYTPNTISRDGSHIEFTVRMPGHYVDGHYIDSQPIAGRLYQRIDNGLPDARTIQINASERTVPATPGEAIYGGASADGTRVFFTTNEPLTNDAPSTETAANLYMWSATPDAQGHHLTLISKDELGGSAEVEGVIGASEDGRTVYFLTTNQIVQGQPTGDGHRIFRWTDGAVHYVTKVGHSETPKVLTAYISGWEDSQRARVTPDGSRLLFVSDGTDELPHNGAGDTCTSKSNDAGNDAPRCHELFLYDAKANGGEGSPPVCVSCMPGDPQAPAASGASFDSLSANGIAIPTSYLNHPLSADGRFVFFDTEEALVPEDTNGVSDIYEFDSSTGLVRLVSTGESKFGSTFEDASPDGSNVFFATAQRVTGWDVDGNADLYDARVGGGLPEPPSPPVSCVGDSCQPPPPSVNDPTPASLTFSGAENPSPVVKKPVKVKHKAVKRSHKRGRHAKHRPHKRTVTRKRGGVK